MKGLNVLVVQILPLLALLVWSGGTTSCDRPVDSYYFKSTAIGLLPSCCFNSDVLPILLEFLKQPVSLISQTFRAIQNPSDLTDYSTTCLACFLLFKLLIAVVKSCTPKSFTATVAFIACTVADAAPPGVCYRVVTQFTPILYALIRRNPDLDPQSACALLFQSPTGCCGSVNEKFTEFNLNIPPPGTATPAQLEQCSLAPSRVGSVKILHFSDFHLDLRFNPKSPVKNDCGVIGCRSKTFEPNVSAQAGPCGAYACDSSLDMVCSAFAHAAAQSCKDGATLIIFLTGDFIHHEIDEVDKKQVIEHINTVLDECVFKKFNQTQCTFFVYPAIGNHDTYPVNNFPLKPFDVFEGWIPGVTSCSSDGCPDIVDQNHPWWTTAWVYEAFVENFEGRMSSTVSTSESFKRAGYFYEDFSKCLRIIVLNDNFFYNFNFALMGDWKDGELISKQLQWLIDALYGAELCGKKAYILMHVPPGISLWYDWCHQLSVVIGRFQGTIAGIFAGHTHKNELRILNCSLVYVAASVSTDVGSSETGGGGVNPCYSVYEVGGDLGNCSATWQVEDQCSYCYDVEDCRMSGTKEKNWQQHCCLKKALGVGDLKCETVKNVFETFRSSSSSSQFEEYFKCVETNRRANCSDEACRNDLVDSVLDPCPISCSTKEA